MNLEAKASRGLPRRRARAEAGYAMAALLVAMTVMAIILTAAMPTWSQMIRREKEEELLFRGNQYARAINQYQRKFANASPATLDVLIEQRLLRKKFRDPFATDKDGEFQMLYLNTQGSASRGMGQTGARGTGARGAGTGQQQTGMGGLQAGSATGTTYSTQPAGGIVGVASKNTGVSIKVYKGKQRYNEWQFIGMEQSLQAGGPAGAAGPGGTGRGGRGTGGREGGRGDGGFGGREGRGGGTMITTPDGGTTFIQRGGGPGGGRGSSPNR